MSALHLYCVTWPRERLYDQWSSQKPITAESELIYQFSQVTPNLTEQLSINLLQIQTEFKYVLCCASEKQKFVVESSCWERFHHFTKYHCHKSFCWRFLLVNQRSRIVCCHHCYSFQTRTVFSFSEV